MFKNAKVLRLIPDQVGRGGTKTSVTSQSKNMDTLFTYQCTVFLGRWRSTSQPISSGLYSTPGSMGFVMASDGISQALNPFPVYDLTNATLAPTTHLLEHLVPSVSGQSASPYQNLIIDHKIFSEQAIIATADFVTGVNECLPATFLNIRNRCFICWGASDTLIYNVTFPTSSRSVDNIIFDPTNPNIPTYDIGGHAPATAPTYVLKDVATGTTSVTNGSTKVNNATVTGNWSSATKGISIDGVAYTVQSPSGYLSSFPAIGTLNTQATAGSPTVTITGQHLPLNGDYNGLTLSISDGGNSETLVIGSYTFSGADTVITATTNAAHNHTNKTSTITGEELILTTAYAGGTSLVATYTAGSGIFSWGGIGPMYAYCYYDPVTGHVTNLSPLIQVTEQNQVAVGIELSNIAYGLDAEQLRFTKILIFRTYVSQGGISGGVLFPWGDTDGAFVTYDNDQPFGTMLNNAPDPIPDSQLLNAPGLEGTPLVNGINRPPVGPFAHMMYWDGRVWGNPVSDPTAITFSADTVQCPFGIPEESYPSGNILRIPAQDGRVTGMKLVGSYGVITTARYAYYIVGNNEYNYRLLRFATTTFGVTDYQMAEFAGDTTENSAALMYLGGDGKIYMLAPDYGNVSISEPVQDLINVVLGNNRINFASTRIAEAIAQARKFLIAQLPQQGNAALTLLYDFDRKIWTVHTLGLGPFTSFASIYSPPIDSGGSFAAPVDFVMSNKGVVLSWFRPPAQSSFPEFAPGQPAVETAPLDFGRKSMKQVNEVRIYVNAGTRQNSASSSDPNNWLVQITVDENTLPQGGSIYVPTVNPDVENQLQGPTSFPVDDQYARELVVMLPQDSANGLIGHRFTVRVIFPQSQYMNNVEYDLYAFDIVYTDLEEPDSESL